MYSIVREYLVENKKSDEFVARLEAEFLPQIKTIPGFVAYYLVQVDLNRCLTINIFNDKTGAEASVAVARDWISSATDLTQILPWPPRVVAGEVTLSSQSENCLRQMPALV